MFQDAPLEPYQAELLETAFDAVSAMPLNPHIRNRSRGQEAVIAACLDLDQPQRALRYIPRIEDWRRGSAYADLAYYAARHGAGPNDVEPYLELALESSQDAEDWRPDRVKMAVARTRAYLGQSEDAARLAQGVEASEAGGTLEAEALVCTPEQFDAQIEALAGLVVSSQFEVVQDALDAYVQLFDGFYADAERREQVVAKIRDAWEPMPLVTRVEALMQLADVALEHSDQPGALIWVDEARDLMDAAQWPVRSEVPLRARLAQRRFLAGQQEAARQEVQQAVELFDAKADTVANIDRAEMLRPLAEAYHAMGDAVATLDLYRRAIEAGVENPNSRPRAQDLAATCCSMAVHGAEPDAELMKRIGEIRDGLGDPW